jgi:hypothetical protein
VAQARNWLGNVRHVGGCQLKVGDLVRMHPTATDRSRCVSAEIAMVVEVQSAWPNDERETDLSVSVCYSDGREESWYDWQLETVSEL